MGEHDQVEGAIRDGGVIGEGVFPHHFWMQSRVDENVEITETDKMGIGSNAAVAVEVDEFHKRGVQSVLAKYFGCGYGVA